MVHWSPWLIGPTFPLTYRLSRLKPRASEKMGASSRIIKTFFCSLHQYFHGKTEHMSTCLSFFLLFTIAYRYFQWKQDIWRREDLFLLFQLVWSNSLGPLISQIRSTRAYLGAGLLCHAPLLTLPFSKKEQYWWCQVTKTCQILLVVSVPYDQGRIQRGRMRDMHSPSSHFQKCFWCIQFFYNFEPLR